MWGMSGGPVFRMVNEEPQLAGLLTDFGEALELFLIAPLAAAEI